jgi:hypothetical protein
MSMNLPGSAIISCLTFLDNVRSVPDRAACVACDATLYLAPSLDTENSHITCSLWYLRRGQTDVVGPGLYEIDAKASGQHPLY